MGFKVVNMNQVKSNVISRLNAEVQKWFISEKTDPDFSFGVEVGDDGVGSIFIEYCDMMDTSIAAEAEKTLVMLVLIDKNTELTSSGFTHPSFRDFRIGAMPSAYVTFQLVP